MRHPTLVEQFLELLRFQRFYRHLTTSVNNYCLIKFITFSCVLKGQARHPGVLFAPGGDCVP
jgi:hypothetical protein